MSKGKIAKFVQEVLKSSYSGPGFGRHINKVRPDRWRPKCNVIGDMDFDH